MGFLVVFALFSYIIMVVMGTIWIWLPILIIVKYRKSKREQEAKQVAQAGVQPAVQGAAQGEIEKKIAALDKKIYAEIEKDEPDTVALKKWREEIKKLKTEQKKVATQTAAPAPAAPATKPQVVASVAQPAEKGYAGMNALLYMGALLVVAGVGSLMLALAEDATRLLIVLLMTVIFYGTGLVVRTNQKLRPAGNALTGTGLAMIPFLGLAFAEFTGMPGEMAWLVTSIVGVAAYLVAAYMMGSKVVAYLAMAFMISTVCSMSATLSLPLIWYFVSVMILGVILAVIRMVMRGNTSRLGAMAEVVNTAGRYLTLLTAVASWTVVWDTNIWFYVAVYAVVAAQAVATWWFSRSMADEVLMRFCLQAAASTLVLAVYEGNLAGTGYGIMIIALVQALVSLFIGMLSAGKDDAKRAGTEQSITLVSMVVIAMSVIPMLVDLKVVLGMAQAVAWGMIGLLAVLALLVYKNSAWLLGLLCSLIAVPLALGSLVLEASSGWYTVVYGAELVLTAAGLIWAALRKVELKVIGEVMLTVLALVTLCTLADQKGEALHAVLSLIIWLWAAAMGAYGWLRQQKWTVEAAIYGGVVGLANLLGNVAFRGVNSGDGTLYWVKAMLILHILVGGLVGVSIWRERGQKQPLRLALAMIGLTIMLGSLAIAAGGYYSDVSTGLLWQFTFLLEEVALLIIGVLVKRNVVWKTGVVGVILAVMWFTKEIAWVWMILIGLGLLAFGIWRLARKQ